MHALGGFVLILALGAGATQQLPPVQYYQSWLQALPWATAPSSPLLQSLSYTGPQTFPQSTQTPPPSPWLGLFRPVATQPVQANFKLPFRPSPFAGYSDDEPEQPQQNTQMSQQTPTELPFHAPGYFAPPLASSRPESQTEPGHYLVMSPSQLYNLFRT